MSLDSRKEERLRLKNILINNGWLFPYLAKDISLLIQEADYILNGVNQKKSTPRYTIIKLENSNQTNKNLKAEREKWHFTCRAKTIQELDLSWMPEENKTFSNAELKRYISFKFFIWLYYHSGVKGKSRPSKMKEN